MITCQELTEAVTDYLEGHMSLGQRWGFRLHLMMCSACRRYLRQMELARVALAHLPVEPVSDTDRAKLMQRFRDWRD